MGLSNEQIVELYKKETDAKKKERLLAIVHIEVNGKSIPEVAEILLKVYNTIKGWYRRFLKYGPDGLDEKPRSGRPPKVKNQTLDKFIYAAECVIPTVLSATSGSRLGVHVPAPTFRRRLHQLDWTPKVPMPVYFRRDSVEDVIRWQRGIKYWISCLSRDGFLLYVMDEANVVLDHVNKRGPWSPRGERVYTPYYGNHRRIVVTAAISSEGPPVTWITDRFRVAEAVGFLEDVMKVGKVGLVMDKAPTHMSRAVQNLIADNSDRLRVRYFPTGWPELNATEHVWSPLKSAAFNHMTYETVDQKVDAVENFINAYHFNNDVKKVILAEPVAKTF